MKFFFLLMFLAILLGANSQPPQAMNYQAIARNPDGSIIAGQAIGTRFSILDGTATGPILYQETHRATTNNAGLFTLSIGKGTVLSGTFSGINWGSGNKFLSVEIATQGSITYQMQGTTQLLSVPYALYAERSGTTGIQGPVGPTGPQGIAGTNGKTIFNGTGDPQIGTGTDGDFYLNTITSQLFGPKTQTGWGAGTSLKGPAGSPGLKSLLDLENFASSPSCPPGGVIIKAGIDQNSNNILEAGEINNTKTICFSQTVQLDKVIIFSFYFSGSTSSTTGVAGGELINFNKNNYPGVDSIVLVCEPYVFQGGIGNTATVELYNLSTNAPIPNSSIVTTRTYTPGFLSSANAYNSLPNQDIWLGVRIRSGIAGQNAGSGKCLLYMYRR